MRRYKLLVMLAILLLLLVPTAQAAKIVTIGIVADGPIEHSSWSPELFKKELLVMTQPDFDVRFPAAKQLDGAWSADRIAAALKQLQKDPEVDMVLTLGYVSSAVAALSGPLRKPTFAPFVMDANLQGLPRKNNASGVHNLNYLSGEADYIRDLQVFKSVADFKKVAVLIDEANFAAQPGLIRRAREVTAARGVELLFIQQRTRNEDLAAQLPPDVDAVVVTDLARLNPAAMDSLIAALIEKKLPSYSLHDSRLVEQGLLMAEAPATDWSRLARRNALNMNAVIRGEPAERQPVSFKSKRRLTINMATARAIGISPRFDILHEALLLHEEPEPQGRPLSLAAMALEAVAANLDLRSAALGLEAGQTTVDEAHANLLPQINASIVHTQLNDDSTAVISGAAAKQSSTAAVTLNQLLYSDQVRTNVTIQRYLQQNRQALKRQLELDIILEATTAYLNLLKAQTFVHIRRDEMNLSRTHLEMARDRQQIGVANPAEAYRWESELATSRQRLLDAQAQLQQARDAVNRLLHRPLKEAFIAESATLDDPRLIVSRKGLFEYVINDRSFERMGDFLVKEGMAASPELTGLEALLAATKQELESRRRAYWSPTITLQGKITNVMDETRVAGLSAENDTDWSVGLNISLPLYEGGARRARVSGSRLVFDQQLSQRDAVQERIEQRIRATLHRIRASHPSIQLSKDAASAANKNLDLVTDAYTRGAVSILDLLDAQNAALVAEESATNAVFDFLIDLMNLQRSVGGFDFFLDAPGLDSWLERLQRYITSAER
ncbi:MAG: TolC family protein [Gammaproteobacteria bacterium]|nr:TolC family protein [Gammaproteobacteria bacterium]